MITDDFFEHFGDALCCLDRDWKVSALNPAASRFLSIEPKAVIGSTVWDRAIVKENPRLAEALRTVMSLRTPLHLDLYLADRDCWTDSRIFPMADGGIGISWRDITEQKKREADLVETVETHEILFGELTHGVTNIFQELASRLNLQSRELVDPAARVMCRKLAVAVRSRSLVYSRLYQGSHTYDQDLGEYLKALCDDLASSLPDSITLSAEAELGTTVTVETAATIGMILVEMVVNSGKHAWPAGEPGKVAVTMRRIGSIIQVEFSDNGRGLPDDISVLQSDGLGLRLMNLQIKRLKGQIAYRKRRGGANFLLTVPVPDLVHPTLERLAGRDHDYAHATPARLSEQVGQVDPGYLGALQDRRASETP